MMRIRVVTGTLGTGEWLATFHPTENRTIRIGDEFDVTKNEDGTRFGWIDVRGYQVSESLVAGNTWFKVIDDNLCKCSVNILMSVGCQCGGK
jgi:hypothetical protein